MVSWSINLMNEFEFETDSKSAEFCEKIVATMMALFRIDRAEAIGRINRDWRGLKIAGPNEVIFHEDETFWANTIYYGKDSEWWLNPANLKPRPF